MLGHVAYTLLSLRRASVLGHHELHELLLELLLRVGEVILVRQGGLTIRASGVG